MEKHIGGHKRRQQKNQVEGQGTLCLWRGNPSVAPTRKDLLNCNVSDKDDWNTRLYVQVN